MYRLNGNSASGVQHSGWPDPRNWNVDFRPKSGIRNIFFVTPSYSEIFEGFWKPRLESLRLASRSLFFFEERAFPAGFGVN